MGENEKVDPDGLEKAEPEKDERGRGRHFRVEDAFCLACLGRGWEMYEGACYTCGSY